MDEVLKLALVLEDPDHLFKENPEEAAPPFFHEEPPVLPEIFPQLTRFAARCGATVPAWLEQRFAGLEDDAETRKLIAAAVAIEQVARLVHEGVGEFHFYTLNRAELTYAICHALGRRPAGVGLTA